MVQELGHGRSWIKLEQGYLSCLKPAEMSSSMLKMVQGMKIAVWTVPIAVPGCP